jgi:hypothetical protein
MKYSLEDELIAGEISFLKPRISKRRAFVEALIGALAIVAFVSVMIWFASL